MQEPDIAAFASRIDMRTFAAWWGYWKAEPFGNPWRRTARLVNFMRAMHGADVTAEDEEVFMPGYRPPVQTEEQMVAELAKIPAFAEQLRAAGRIK